MVLNPKILASNTHIHKQKITQSYKELMVDSSYCTNGFKQVGDKIIFDLNVLKS